MNDANGSKYGKGFALRMTILLGLLALVSVGLFYDKVILPNMANATIEEAYKLMTAPDEDGHGITKDTVQKTIGFPPEATIKQDNYDIEKYTFKRALPFMEGDYLNVIYENGALIQILKNQEYSPEKVESSITVRSPSTYSGNKPLIGGGGPPPADDDDEDDLIDDESEEEAENQESDPASADASDEDDNDDGAADNDGKKESEDKDDTEKKSDSDEDGDG